MLISIVLSRWAAFFVAPPARFQRSSGRGLSTPLPLPLLSVTQGVLPGSWQGQPTGAVCHTILSHPQEGQHLGAPHLPLLGALFSGSCSPCIQVKNFMERNHGRTREPWVITSQQDEQGCHPEDSAAPRSWALGCRGARASSSDQQAYGKSCVALLCLGVNWLTEHYGSLALCSHVRLTVHCAQDGLFLYLR